MLISKFRKLTNLVHFGPKKGKIGENSFICNSHRKVFIGPSWHWYLVHPLRHWKFLLLWDALRGCSRSQGQERLTNPFFGRFQLKEWYCRWKLCLLMGSNPHLVWFKSIHSVMIEMPKSNFWRGWKRQKCVFAINNLILRQRAWLHSKSIRSDHLLRSS